MKIRRKLYFNYHQISNTHLISSSAYLVKTLKGFSGHEAQISTRSALLQCILDKRLQIINAQTFKTFILSETQKRFIQSIQR